MVKELIKSLSLLGLSEKEANIYLTLYKLWNTRAWNIVKETWIPRATVYQILDKLVWKWYVMMLDSDNIQSYFAEEPEIILNKIKDEEEKLIRKKKIFSSLLPKIVKIKNPYFKEPKVIYFEWVNSYIDLLDDVLNSWEKEIFMITNTQIKSNHIADEVKNLEIYNYEVWDFLQERLKRWIKMNLITTRLDFWEEILKTDKEYNRETKILPDDFWDIETMIIYWEKMILLNDNSPIIWIFIEDFQMKNMLKNIFKFIWNKI